MLTFVTEEIRLIVVQYEMARNSIRTIYVLVATFGGMAERPELAENVASMTLHITPTLLPLTPDI